MGMSWILNHAQSLGMKHKIKIYIKWVIVCIALLCIVCVLYINNVWIYITFLIAIIMLLVNKNVYDKAAFNSTHLFTTIDRNYDYLVIGDYCDISNYERQGKTIAYLSPKLRSMEAIELLVMRLYSLLDEEKGELIIIKDKKGKSSKISVFDIPFLHEITLNKLGLSKMKYLCRLPLLFAPIGSIRLLLSIRRKGILQESKCPSEKLAAFCESRHIKYKFYYLR